MQEVTNNVGKLRFQLVYCALFSAENEKFLDRAPWRRQLAKRFLLESGKT
jgi:hypothetical protein